MRNLYNVVILPLAESDIADNTDYIFFDKRSPETAKRLLQGFYETISGLEFMPQQHELDEDEELSSKGIRKCYYKNYKIFLYRQIKKDCLCFTCSTYAG